MAVLDSMPQQSIVDGFKGTVDFYMHQGRACARSWPRSPGHRRSPAVEAQWPAFTLAARLWSQLSPAVQAAYRQMAQGTNYTAKDLFTKGYLSDLYRDGEWGTDY